MTKTVYIVGSKGIPAKYGGFETFVEKLTEFQQDKDIQYYVACMREKRDLQKADFPADINHQAWNLICRMLLSRLQSECS